jgi:hypothetical protein
MGTWSKLFVALLLLLLLLLRLGVHVDIADTVGGRAVDALIGCGGIGG